MRSLICRVCGASNSEFDSQCAACGALLPDPTGTTWDNGKRPPQDDAELLPGQQISNFRILGRLGKGGMGEVYRALDLSPLNRVVALKFLHERRQRDLARLEREAQTAAALDHPNIGTIYDFRKSDGRHFLVMALYDGETLAERLARQPDRQLPVAEAAAITSRLADALQAIHAVGLVHRDVKPENVMILPDGRVKLIDFGLARWTGTHRLTAPGWFVGTIPYMAPEQFDENKEVGPAADLWALGVVLYEMLAGRHPFEGKGMGIRQSIINEEPFPLKEARADVPAALEKIVERCLVKDPDKRYSSAGDILAELQDSGLLGSGTIVLPARLAGWQRWMIGASAALLVGIVIYLYLEFRKPPTPIYVAVLKPVVTGSLQPDDQALVMANLQASLLRTVGVLDGLAALDPDNKLTGSPIAVARALGADEVVTSQADCAGDLCKVILSRLAGRDGRVLWKEVLQQQLPPSKPQLFAEAVAASLRQGYGDHKLRVPRLELETREEDYRIYLELRSRADVPGALKAVLDGLEALRQQAPTFVEVYSLEANVARRLYRLSGDRHYLERGIAVAQQARKRAPSDPRPLANFFYLYLDAGRYQDAEKVLEQLKVIDPAGSLLKRGLLAERQGHPKEGLALIAEGTRLQPSWQALLMLANREYDQGQLDEARRHYEELLQRVPDKLEGLKGVAQIEFLRNPEQAIPLLRDITAKAPNDGGSFNNLGMALLLRRRYTEAEDSFRRALKLQPDSPANILSLADCLTLLHRSQEAHPLYLDVVAKADRTATPGNWEILSVEAQALAHLGNSTQAVEILQQALHTAPNSPQLACAAAVVYTFVGDYDSALRHARLAAPGALENPFLDPLRRNPAFLKLLKGDAADPPGLGPS